MGESGVYACCSCSIYVAYPKQGRVVILPLRCGRVRAGPLQCQQCKEERDFQIVRGILVEQERGPLRWVEVDSNDEKTVIQNFSRYGTRYLRLPGDDKTAFVFSETDMFWLAGKLIPIERGDLQRLVAHWTDAQAKRRISATRKRKDEDGNPLPGWGKTESGNTDGKEKGIALKVELPVSQLADYLRAAGGFHLHGIEVGVMTFALKADDQETLEAALERSGLIIENNGPAILVDRGKSFCLPESRN